MIRSHSVTVLLKHGYGIEQGVQCRAAGKNICGVHWQDSNGAEHSVQLVSKGVPETIASLHERELKNAVRWDYTYATCEVCKGTAKSSK